MIAVERDACRACGVTVPARAQFCPTCGASQVAEFTLEPESPSPEVVTDTVRREPQRWLPYALVAAAIALVVGLGFALSNLGSDDAATGERLGEEVGRSERFVVVSALPVECA